jgi:hypothetical protein
VVLDGNEGSTFGLESGGDIVMLDQRPQSQALLLLLLLHPARLASGRPRSVECAEAGHEERPADYGQRELERELELAQQGQRRAR